jgi:hypothetical protein
MPHPTEARQLPGVNGQWILYSECPPTIADLDEDEELVVRKTDVYCRVIQLSQASGYEYWAPAVAADPRPITLPAAPVPEQAAAGKRKFVQLVWHPNGTAIYAVADDGTAWTSSEDLPDWNEVGDLPDREVPNA